MFTNGPSSNATAPQVRSGKIFTKHMDTNKETLIAFIFRKLSPLFFLLSKSIVLPLFQAASERGRLKKLWDTGVTFVGKLNPWQTIQPALNFGKRTEKTFKWSGSRYVVCASALGVGGFGAVYK